MDLKKAYDPVHRDNLQNAMQDFKIQRKLISVVRMSVCENATSRVRTAHGTSGPFPLTVGLKQEDILSPCLFNLALEHALRQVCTPMEGPNNTLKLKSAQPHLLNVAYHGLSVRPCPLYLMC